MRLYAILPHFHKEALQLKRIRDAITLQPLFLFTHVELQYCSAFNQKPVLLRGESPPVKL
jgi:hypothetical protein